MAAKFFEKIYSSYLQGIGVFKGVMFRATLNGRLRGGGGMMAYGKFMAGAGLMRMSKFMANAWRIVYGRLWAGAKPMDYGRLRGGGKLIEYVRLVARVAFCLLVLLISTMPVSSAQETIPSQIKELTLFSNQALITREATVKVKQGVNELVLATNAFQIDRDSVSAKVFGRVRFSVSNQEIYT